MSICGRDECLGLGVTGVRTVVAEQNHQVGSPAGLLSKDDAGGLTDTDETAYG
jgi:hypothetical protein